MDEDKEYDLLKHAGYSERAIEYYIKKVNVGTMEDADATGEYTGVCGDNMKIYLKISDGIIIDAKFQGIGCAASLASGSALTEMIKKMKLNEAKRLNMDSIKSYLGGLPEIKNHCPGIPINALKEAIHSYGRVLKDA